jgi:GDPmannose 4,6-dehydratase
MPTALVTGVTGQDGAYLAQLLLQKGYTVVGLMRRSASSDVIGERLRWLGILGEVQLVEGNLIDLSSLIRVRSTIWPRKALSPRAGSSRC